MPTVLVVDDDAQLIDMLGVFLVRRGWSVLKALTAVAALKLAKEAAPDIALCDVNLPDMSGFAFTRAIRSERATQGLPLVLISGSRKAAEDVLQGLNEGGNGYLLKPVDLNLLEAKLEAVVKAAHAS